jgi:hypothetical protein
MFMASINFYLLRVLCQCSLLYSTRIIIDITGICFLNGDSSGEDEYKLQSKQGQARAHLFNINLIMTTRTRSLLHESSV